MYSLQIDALHAQVPSQRHEPCISQSHSEPISAEAAHPHAASSVVEAVGGGVCCCGGGVCSCEDASYTLLV